MFTCNTCGLEFPTAESQRIHMKSDWHRYNLKRRVAQLPPIDEQTFNSKVSTLAENDENTKQKQLTKKEQRRREKEALQMRKRELLETAKRAMLAKIKNGEAPALNETTESTETESENPETPADVSDITPAMADLTVSPEDAVPESELTDEQLEEKLYKEKLASKIDIKPTTCLFSHPKYNKNFDTVDENIEHMFKTYGLYIPEQNYLVDKEGLISYLGEKIGFGFCISCNYQGRNAEAAREHMRQKRHMRIPYETEDEKLEISKFYDFLSTYDDVAPVVAVDGEVDEEDWEDVSGEEEEEDDDDLPPMEEDAIYRDGYDLILPSGTVLGHRAFQRYYRQNLPPERVLSEGQGTVIAAETRHMLTVKDRQELAATKRAWSRQKKREDVNDRRAQKFINNQPHFRDPLLQ